MSEHRLTVDLLERITQLVHDWEELDNQRGGDEETHWDAVKWYRSVSEWAHQELAKRHAKAVSRRVTEAFNAADKKEQA